MRINSRNDTKPSLKISRLSGLLFLGVLSTCTQAFAQAAVAPASQAQNNGPTPNSATPPAQPLAPAQPSATPPPQTAAPAQPSATPPPPPAAPAQPSATGPAQAPH